MGADRAFEPMQDDEGWGSMRGIEVMDVQKVAVWGVEPFHAGVVQVSSPEEFSPEGLCVCTGQPPGCFKHGWVWERELGVGQMNGIRELDCTSTSQPSL